MLFFKTIGLLVSTLLIIELLLTIAYFDAIEVRVVVLIVAFPDFDAITLPISIV